MKMLISSLLMAALGLVLSGLLIGYALPVHDDYDRKCGTAFYEDSDARVDQLTNTMTGDNSGTNCDAWRNQALQIPIALIALGVTAAAVAGVIEKTKPEPRSTPDAP